MFLMISVSKAILRCVRSTKVEIWLNDTLHMEHEVDIYLHESAECGRSVKVRSTKHSGITF